MAIHVGVGLSTEKDPLGAVREAVRQARNRIRSERVSCALVFSSLEFAHANTLKALKHLLGPVPVIGCSSLALITGEGVFRHALGVALISLPSDIQFNIARVADISRQPLDLAGSDLGTRLSYGFRNIRRDLSVVFSDGFMSNGSGFFEGFQQRMGKSLPLAGGSASDDLQTQKTYVYYESEVLGDSACGILWGGRMHFAIGIKHGWQPLGKPRMVTRAKNNVVYEIDGAAAVTFYEDYFNANLATLRRELKRISILYPIGIHLPGEEEYLLRNILSIEADGSIVFQGTVPEESQIQLMIGTKESCLQATREAADQIKRNMVNSPLDFLLIFDSVSRYILLGRKAHQEIEVIKKHLGYDIPILGVYTYGEQAPLKAVNYQGRAHFHNQTISLVGIGS